MAALNTKQSKIFLLPAIFAGAVIGGCVVEPREDTTTRVHLEILLDLPLSVHSSTDVNHPDRAFRSGFSSVNLADNPLAFSVEVSAVDLRIPATARYAGDPGNDDTIDLVLDVSSGENRELFLILYHWDSNEVSTYRALETGLLFEPGDQLVSLEPKKVDTWVLDGVLEGVGDKVPIGVVVEDVQTRIEFPETPVEEGPLGWEFSVPYMPVGRFFYVRVHWDDNTWTDPLNFCPLFFGQSTNILRVFNLQDASC